MNRLIVLFIATIFSLEAIAQGTNRYVVFFKDKVNTPYSINQPEEFLSAKSIQRKGRIITQEDLPVTPAYISELKNNGALLIGTTKWLNAALIELDEVDLPSINSLSFVEQVEYVASGEKSVIGGRYSSGEELDDTYTSNEVLIQQKMLNVDVMHLDGYFGEGMLIAVLDGGFTNVDQISYFTHLYDNQQVQDVKNFVTNGLDVYDYSDHGTRIFSTMAALGANYKGIATKADYLLYVTEDSGEYRIEEYNWLLAAERADSIGVDIITTSLGYTYFDDPTMDYTHDDLDGKTAVITIAAEKAFERGIVVVTSAGNSGNKTWEKVTPPADGEHVLAIGSVDEFQVKSDFSSIGSINAKWTKPDLMAMGERTILIGQSGNLSTGNGTSFAAPQVASLVAGIWGKYPELSNIELTDIIRKSANRGGSPDDNYGYGIPSYQAFENFFQAITQSDFLNVYPNPILNDGFMRVKVRNPNAIDNLGLVIYTTSGKKIFESKESISWQNNPVLIDLNDLSKGIYIAKIITAEQIVTKRIIKQ